MMRTLTGLMVALVLGLASAATAATISVDTNKKTYNPGDSIVMTVVTTISGAEGLQAQYVLELLWNDAQIAGVPGPMVFGVPLTSFGGGLPWFQSIGTCLAASCLVLDELSPIIPTATADATAATGGPRVGTLTMIAGLEGLINFSFGVVTPGGGVLAPSFGGNAATAEVIPEPTTAALLGLGLTGLALAGRRRR